MSSEPKQVAAPPRKRRRWGRVLLWIGGIILFLILLIVLAVQIILMSDLPRRVLVEQASKALGLRIEAKGFRAGWWGHSRLTGLTAALPLADHPFLRVPEVAVDNTSLLMIALTRSVEIDQVVIRKPVIEVIQRPTGQWNVQQVIDLFAARGKSSGRETDKSSGPPKLPKIIVQDATVEVADNQGRRTTVQQVDVRGEPSTPLAYALEVKSQGRLRLQGTVALNRTFHQEFTLEMQGLGPWVKPWIGSWPDTAALAAAWDGAVSPSGQLQGQLRLQPLRVGKRTVRGVAKVELDQGRLTIRPDAMLLATGMPAPMDRIDLRSGQVVVGDGEVKVRQLLAALAQGSIQINGQADLSGQRASAEVKWQNLHLPAGIEASGTLNAELQTPWPGQPRIGVDMTAQGTSPQGAWDLSRLTVRGGGPSYAALNWTIQTNALTVHRPDNEPYEVTNFLAHVTTEDGKVALTDLNLEAPAKLSGRGAYDLSANTWWLWVDSSGWPFGGEDTFGFSINAWGDSKYITLHELYAHSGRAELVVRGYYGYGWPKPLDLNLYATHPPAEWGDRPQSGPIQGRFNGYADAVGTIYPLAVEVSGRLHARHLVVLDHALDDIDAVLKGQIRSEQSHGRLNMRLADGQWNLEAVYPQTRKARTGFGSGDRFTQVKVSADGVSLASLGKMVKVKGLSGQAKGDWTIDLPSLSLRKISVDGNVTAQNMEAGGQRLESLTARTTLKQGLFKAQEIVAKQAGGPGQARAQAWVDLSNPSLVEGTFQAKDWTMDIPAEDLRLVLQGGSDGNLIFHLKGSGMDGKLSAKAAAQLAGKPAGSAELDLRFSSGKRQLVDLTRLQGGILGGVITGHMSAEVESLASAGDFWKWSDFNGRIHGEHLQLGQSSRWSASPFLKDVGGAIAFTATGGPATRPHPLEPQYFNLTVAAEGAKGAYYRDLHFASANLHVYLGNERVVFASDPDQESVIVLADGRIVPWLRVSRHEGAGYFALLNGRFERIDLDQIVQTAAPNAQAMPGRLSGDFHFQGDLAVPRNLNGNGSLRIADSDLVNFDPLELLYNLLNVGGNPKTPTGHGRFDLSLEQSKLTISNGHYFNRGIDAIGSLTIDDIWMGKESPIHGGVVGTARPLKDVKLPLIADADKLLANLQSFLTAVGVAGTLEKPKPYQTTLSNFGGGLQKAILGDVKKAKQ